MENSFSRSVVITCQTSGNHLETSYFNNQNIIIIITEFVKFDCIKKKSMELYHLKFYLGENRILVAIWKVHRFQSFFDPDKRE